MIELSVRAFAELMRLPGYEQERILHEQKYPRQQPNRFRVPYYNLAKNGIHKYYRSQNNLNILRSEIQTISAKNIEPVRRQNNVRVLRSFQGSPESSRQIVQHPGVPPRHT